MRNYVIAKCILCGKEFKTFQYKINRGDGKYCSNSCKGKAGRKSIGSQFGSKNPMPRSQRRLRRGHDAHISCGFELLGFSDFNPIFQTDV